MIQATLRRVLPIVEPERVWVVALADHLGAIAEQLPEVPRENLIGEPVGKNTAMAIGLGAVHVSSRDPAAVMVSIGSDHSIGDEDAFRRTLLSAAEAARGGDRLVTIGIQPRYAHTGYGYIRRGEELGRFDGIEAFRVTEFREKPDAETAQAYFESGEYLWNSNYFAWRVRAILAAFHDLAPDIARQLDRVAAAVGSKEYSSALTSAYESVKREAIDTAIIEKAGNVLTVPGRFPWADVGSWSGAYELARREGRNFRTGSNAGKVIFEQSEGCLVDSGDRLVAVIGLEGVVIVDTPDALLICSREKAELAGEVVRRIEREGPEELL